MIHRLLPVMSCFLLAASGCCCPPTGSARVHDPLRDVGVDQRPIGQAPGASRGAPRQVFVDMTIVRVPEGLVDEVLGARRPARVSEPVAVSAEEARSLLAAWRANAAVQQTSAPKLLALPGQRATVFIGESVRFARTEARTNERGGLEFAIHEDAGGSVDLGENIAVVANPSDDGRRVSLDIKGTWRELTRDIAPDERATLTRTQFDQNVRVHEIETAFEMDSETWVVVGNPAWIPTAQGRVAQVVLLRASVIDERDGRRRVIAQP